jgi:hypothetical protein
VLEQEVLARFQSGARAAAFADAVGLGWYPMDIHGVPGDVAATGPTKPFQIPLGALVPHHPENLLPACKNLGVTHMTNGCYRLHPVEWNVGEAAARLAVFCLGCGASPAVVLGRPERVAELQRELVQHGVPVYWYDDLPYGHPASEAAQLLAVTGLWPEAEDHLRFDPEEVISPAEVAALAGRAGLSIDRLGVEPRSRASLAQALAAERFDLGR